MHGAIKDGTFYKTEKEKSKLWMRITIGGVPFSPSWTINMGEVGDATNIQYATEHGFYDISLDSAKTNGRFMTLGAEIKLVVPVVFWTFTKRGRL